MADGNGKIDAVRALGVVLACLASSLPLAAAAAHDTPGTEGHPRLSRTPVPAESCDLVALLKSLGVVLRDPGPVERALFTPAMAAGMWTVESVGPRFDAETTAVSRGDRLVGYERTSKDLTIFFGTASAVDKKRLTVPAEAGNPYGCKGNALAASPTPAPAGRERTVVPVATPKQEERGGTPAAPHPGGAGDGAANAAPKVTAIPTVAASARGTPPPRTTVPPELPAVTPVPSPAPVDKTSAKGKELPKLLAPVGGAPPTPVQTLPPPEPAGEKSDKALAAKEAIAKEAVVKDTPAPASGGAAEAPKPIKRSVPEAPALERPFVDRPEKPIERPMEKTIEKPVERPVEKPLPDRPPSPPPPLLPSPVPPPPPVVAPPPPLPTVIPPSPPPALPPVAARAAPPGAGSYVGGHALDSRSALRRKASAPPSSP